MSSPGTVGPQSRTYSFATAAAALLALLWPASLAAQGIGLEVDGGYRSLAGDELAGLESGFSAHAIGSYAWASGWEAGVGAGISFHDPAAGTDGDITEVIGFARYRFNVPAGSIEHVHPFLEGRAGFARFHTSAAGDPDVSQGGFLIGGQGGAEFWLTDEVGLVGALAVEYLSFSADDGLPERSGWSLRPHVGLKLRY